MKKNIETINWKELTDEEKREAVAVKVAGWNIFQPALGPPILYPPDLPAVANLVYGHEVPDFLHDCHLLINLATSAKKRLSVEADLEHLPEPIWTVRCDGWSGTASRFCEAAAIALIRSVGCNVIT
jgi:hypothetical protein